LREVRNKIRKASPYREASVVIVGKLIYRELKRDFTYWLQVGFLVKTYGMERINMFTLPYRMFIGCHLYSAYVDSIIDIVHYYSYSLHAGITLPVAIRD